MYSIFDVAAALDLPLLQCQAITVLGIAGISTFWKTWVQVWGEYILQFRVSG